MARRRSRRPQYTCRCGAYHFPHRFGGGRCTGLWIAEEQWEKSWGSGDCRHCLCCNRTEAVPYCEVVVGQEVVEECPVYQEFVHFHEITKKRRRK